MDANLEVKAVPRLGVGNLKVGLKLCYRRATDRASDLHCLANRRLRRSARSAAC